ncbi:MAG: DUF1501 domain-containing protein [Pelagimonas sp.]|jgi:uncharacterized protein (DUF1501 family)|nr:DUF1501 domain-containing protein [Pelagimonas sp.]
MDRRAFLTRSVTLGCSLAASPLLTPISFAAAPGDSRLVVIILRGGMDGLGVVSPYGDPDFAGHRGVLPLGGEGWQDLDGFFALHPGLAPLMPLWTAGQLGFVHAVSTPYRDKRSHFDGQDLLEAGGNSLSGGIRGGWLNRMLPHLAGAQMGTAYALGRDSMAVLNGAAPVRSWSPDTDLALSPQAIRLAELVMQDDPAMAAALSEAFSLASSDGDDIAVEGGRREMMAMLRDDMRGARRSGEKEIAQFAAGRLREEARIAAFSLNGWDTHAQQERSLTRALTRLSNAILALQEGLGNKVWNQTTVVAVTEFGRTARLNGTKGTDHGTGGAMLLAGGAIKGGRVLGDWPGLGEADLYARRDLMPTRDLRAHLGWIMRGMFDLPRDVIEAEILPGVDLGTDPGLLL